ncbi:recombination-associated protein RdgC [bacterium]|nr:recombination-associated protein RdgC [bacterium]
MSFLKSKFSLCVLNVPEDVKFTQGEIFNKLQQQKFKEVPASKEFGDGWAHVSDLFKDFTMEDSVVVNSMVGGYRYDKKKVPSALVKNLYLQKLRELQKESGDKITRDEKKLLKDECKSQLLMQTLPSPKLATWIWDIDNHKIYLATKSLTVVDSFTALFDTTFNVYLSVEDFSLEEEDDLTGFLDYLWGNLDENEDTKNEAQNFWFDHEVTFDFDKNTFKFNGPRIEEYKDEIEDFKKSKRIKSLNVGLAVGGSEYSVTFNSKNMLLDVESLAKIQHEDVETAILDNQDRINVVTSEVKNIIGKYLKG